MRFCPPISLRQIFIPMWWLREQSLREGWWDPQEAPKPRKCYFTRPLAVAPSSLCLAWASSPDLPRRSR